MGGDDTAIAATCGPNAAIHIAAGVAVERVLLWTAHSATQDFRDAHWTSEDCAKAGEGYACAADRAPTGYTAAFAETSFADGHELSFSTSTTVCIAAPDRTRAPAC